MKCVLRRQSDCNRYAIHHYSEKAPRPIITPIDSGWSGVWAYWLHHGYTDHQFVGSRTNSAIGCSLLIKHVDVRAHHIGASVAAIWEYHGLRENGPAIRVRHEHRRPAGFVSGGGTCRTEIHTPPSKCSAHRAISKRQSIITA